MTSVFDCCSNGVAYVGPTAPANPYPGQLWANSTTGAVSWWDSGASAWKPIGSGGAGGGSNTLVSATDPGAAGQPDGTGWFNPTTGELKIANGGAWVDLGGGGSNILVSATDPGATGQPDGTGWFNPIIGELKVANGGAWVDAAFQSDETYQYEALPAAANIGVAWTASGANVTEDTVFATWGTPGSVYQLIDKTDPTAAANWRKLGDIRDFATQAEINAGTEANKVISPAGLRGTSLAAPSGATAAAGDADKLVRLSPQGLIDERFLQISTMIYRGSVDITTVAPTTWNIGDFGHVAAPGGTIDASFTGVAGQTATTGDLLTFDGTNYHLIPQRTDIPAFASQAEVHTGTATNLIVNPATLRGETLNAPSGAGGTPAAADADKLPRLDANGLVDDGFIPKATGPQVITGTAGDLFLTPAALRAATVVAPGGAGGAPAAADANKLVRLDATGALDADLLDVDVPTEATDAQIVTGTDQATFVSPQGLRDASLNAPTGVGGTATAVDSNKLVRLDATGQIDTGFLPAPVAEATAAQVTAGTDGAAFVSSRRLRGETLDAPSTGVIAAADANKIPRLGAGGALENTFVEAGRFWEIWVGTQTAYDALATTAAPPGPGYDANTLYAITGP